MSVKSEQSIVDHLQQGGPENVTVWPSPSSSPHSSEGPRSYWYKKGC